MEYIRKLFIENSEKIDTLLGADFRERSSQDILATSEVLQANEVLSEDLYDPAVASLVKANDTEALDKLYLDVLESVSVPEFKIHNLNTNQIGLVVIRPEAMGLVASSRELLARNGLRILLEKTTQISFNQYWALYSAGLRDPEAKYDFPTRTLNYINKDIQILVVAGQDADKETEPVSTFINDKLKGSQGTFSENTLRGQIAYTALKGLLGDDGFSFATSQVNVALDPIGAYRQLVRGSIKSDRMHAMADSPLLFYAGQSMHVPNNTEIQRDIRILLSEEEIANVTEGLRR